MASNHEAELKRSCKVAARFHHIPATKARSCYTDSNYHTVSVRGFKSQWRRDICDWQAAAANRSAAEQVVHGRSSELHLPHSADQQSQLTASFFGRTASSYLVFVSNTPEKASSHRRRYPPLPPPLCLHPDAAHREAHFKVLCTCCELWMLDGLAEQQYSCRCPRSDQGCPPNYFHCSSSINYYTRCLKVELLYRNVTEFASEHELEQKKQTQDLFAGEELDRSDNEIRSEIRSCGD